MKRKTYKRLIFDIDQLDQLESYLSIATENIAPHASPDCEKFYDITKKQIDDQKFEHKRNLLLTGPNFKMPLKCRTFIQWLESTLVPDLKDECNMPETAKDFEKLIRYLKEAYKVEL